MISSNVTEHDISERSKFQYLSVPCKFYHQPASKRDPGRPQKGWKERF